MPNDSGKDRNAAVAARFEKARARLDKALKAVTKTGGAPAAIAELRVASAEAVDAARQVGAALRASIANTTASSVPPTSKRT